MCMQLFMLGFALHKTRVKFLAIIDLWFTPAELGKMARIRNFHNSMLLEIFIPETF